MIRPLRHLLRALLLAALAVAPAVAQVSGSAEWGWTDFRRDSSAEEIDADASSFMQKYSILYSTRGEFNAGRAGSWNLSLGYEWASLDSSVNDIDKQVSTGKFLYSGDLLFAPGGLPLRVHLFSYDLNESFPLSFNQGLLLTPNVATDIGDAGQHIVTGMTLLAGIKNGSYLGQYREMLSQIPRILVDYKQTYIRNLDSIHVEHTRLRDLAFVSLNKKDNWFHYRVSQYEDFEDPTNDYEKRVYMLGTVDHTLARQWINLTNWIQLSVDGSLEQDSESGNPESDSYMLNLFTKFNRKTWTASNYTNYERTLEYGGGAAGNHLEKRLEIPVFAYGQIDPRNRWRATYLHKSEEDSNSDIFAEPDLTEHLDYATLQVESQRDSGIIVTSNAAFDMKRGSQNDEGQAIKLGIEARTDRRRDLLTTWNLGYDLSVFNGQVSGDYYFEHGFRAAIDHQASPTMSFGGTEQLAIGMGQYQAYSTEYLKPALAGRVDYANFTDSDIEGSSWRSQTSLYLELLGPSRWKNRFTADLDYIDRAGDTSYNLQLAHVANYSTRDWYLNMESRYESGDEVEVQVDSSALRGSSILRGTVDQGFSHQTTLVYSPMRAWQLGSEATVTWVDGKRGSATLAHLEQNARYNLFATGGNRRRIMLFEQELICERLFGDVEGTPWYAELNLASHWYASRFLTLGARGQFRHFGESGANVFEYGINSEVKFEKLYVNISYEYGYAEEGWETDNPQLTEHRWGVDVKKTF